MIEVILGIVWIISKVIIVGFMIKSFLGFYENGKGKNKTLHYGVEFIIWLIIWKWS